MRRLLLLFFVLLLLSGTVMALEGPAVDTEALEEGVPEEASEVLPALSLGAEPDFWGSLQALFSNAFGKSGGGVKQALRLCMILLCVMLLCSFADISRSRRYGGAMTIAGALGLCAVFFGSAGTMVALARQTIREMMDYGALMLPVLATASAMSGQVATGTALYTGTMIFSQVILRLVSGLLIPGVYCYLALAAAEAALENEILSELRELLGWIISKSLRMMVYLFLGFLGITGVISGAADATALRATKATLSGLVPVVGSIISDASETLLAGAAAIRSSVGVFGMLVVLAICIVPFLRIGAQYLLLKLTTAVSGTIGLPTHTKLMKHFSEAMGYLLAMCGSCCFLLLISIVCFLKVVV